MIWLLLPAILVAGLLIDLFVLTGANDWSPAWRDPGYTVVPTHWLPALLGSAAVTLGNRVFLKRAITPSAAGLAHEYYHVLHTSWVRYAWSRLTGGVYHLEEEKGAAEYSKLYQHGFELDADSLAWHLVTKVTMRGVHG
jgi:hypothetical protein